MNDKQIIFCVLQISGNFQSNRDQFHLAEYTCLPITAPSINYNIRFNTNPSAQEPNKN